MTKSAHSESEHTVGNSTPANGLSASRGLPSGLLVSQRFGVRGRRFNPTDVLDWIRRGAPTRVS